MSNFFNDHLNFSSNLHDNLYIRKSLSESSLTNYYKNLCEQLQKQIEILEANIRSPAEIIAIGRREHEEAIRAEERKLGRRLTSKESDELADKVFRPYATRAARRGSLVGRAMEELPDVAQTGDTETAQAVADVMKDMSTTAPGSTKQAGYADLPSYGRESLIKTKQETAELQQELRKRGVKTTVHPDVAAMRRFIELGKGKYKAPFSQP